MATHLVPIPQPPVLGPPLTWLQLHSPQLWQMTYLAQALPPCLLQGHDGPMHGIPQGDHWPDEVLLLLAQGREQVSRIRVPSVGDMWLGHLPKRWQAGIWAEGLKYRQGGCVSYHWRQHLARQDICVPPSVQSVGANNTGEFGVLKNCIPSSALYCLLMCKMEEITLDTS